LKIPFAWRKMSLRRLPGLRIAMLSPIAWRTPPRHYGPWEQIASNLAEGLASRGIEVTLFATADSLTAGALEAVCPRGYEEDKSLDAKAWECLHIAHLMEQADRFDLIHNHFDFLPLSYSRLIATPMLTTIHGFSSLAILPVFERYDGKVHYVSISNADRSPRLHYIATVYHGVRVEQFTFRGESGNYLLFFGRIHQDKGAWEAIQIARRAGMRLLLSGIIQDRDYFEGRIRPLIDGRQVEYLGPSGPAERDRLLGGAFALLHPINFAEPFGLSVVESMLCGTPVVAFPRGSMRELIAPGTSGFLVDTIEEAVAVLQRVGRIDRRACRRWAEERFSAERMVEDYLEVYRRILTNG
jgi:glycosyltransferase involved in cell wall biosynthesis